MLYPQPGVRKYVFFVTYGAPKTYSFICSNKYFKQQKEKEYVLVCLPYVTRMYSYYVIRMSFICTPMSSVCHSYVLVCHPYVTRIRFYHEPKKRARNNTTFIGTKHIQNVIKLKQNFLNNLFQYFCNFPHILLGYHQFYLRMLSKHFEAVSFLSMYHIFCE